MSEQSPQEAAAPDQTSPAGTRTRQTGTDESGVESPEDYGSLTVEDSEAVTVDPGDVAGTAHSTDEEVTYSPEHSEADTE
jgi:hypothetical protein